MHIELDHIVAHSATPESNLASLATCLPVRWLLRPDELGWSTRGA